MEPEPLVAAVERRQQHVRARELAQLGRRAAALEDGVAEVAAQPVEDRGAAQEVELAAADRLEEFFPDVVDDEPVVPGEAGDRLVEVGRRRTAPGRRGTWPPPSPRCDAPGCRAAPRSAPGRGRAAARRHSPVVISRSPAPSSMISRWTRSLPIGRAGSVRVASTSWEPGGRVATIVVTTASASGESIRSKSSRTRTNGTWRARSDARRVGAARPSRCSARGWRGRPRPRAPPARSDRARRRPSRSAAPDRCAARRGSGSGTGRGSRSAHCSISTDLP